jgi:hypothetical protein
MIAPASSKRPASRVECDVDDDQQQHRRVEADHPQDPLLHGRDLRRQHAAARLVELVQLARGRPEVAGADGERDGPQDEREVDPERPPAEAALLDHRDAEGEHDDARRREDALPELLGVLDDRREVARVVRALREQADDRQRYAAADPDDGERDVQRLVDLVRARRLPEEDDRADEEDEPGEQRQLAAATVGWRRSARECGFHVSIETDTPDGFNAGRARAGGSARGRGGRSGRDASAPARAAA